MKQPMHFAEDNGNFVKFYSEIPTGEYIETFAEIAHWNEGLMAITCQLIRDPSSQVILEELVAAGGCA